jgi:hypothetical protein
VKKLLIGLVLVVLLASSVACASSLKSGVNPVQGSTGEFTIPATTTLASKPTFSVTPSPGGVSGPSDNQVSIDRMVVRTGNLQLVVSNVTDAIDQVTRIATDNGGYVVSSQKSKYGERIVGNISIRILADN